MHKSTPRRAFFYGRWPIAQPALRCGAARTSTPDDRLQVMRASDGVVVVGRNLFKAEIGVERARRLHAVQRIEQDAVIAQPDGAGHRVVDQLAAQAKAAEGLAHVEALHLAGIAVVHIIQRPQCAATGDGTLDQGEYKIAPGLAIFAGQVGQFILKTLETQINIQ